MKLTKFIIVLFISFVNDYVVISQTTSSAIAHYSIDEGLPDADINCMVMDHKGFLWIGTGNGLVKFDGYRFVVFKSEVNNENTLTNNIIHTIEEDKDGLLWIATDRGMARLDPSTGKIKRYMPDKDNKNSIVDKGIVLHLDTIRNLVYIGYNSGMQIFDPVKERYSDVKVFNNNNILGFYTISDQQLLVSSDYIYNWDLKNENISILQDTYPNRPTHDDLSVSNANYLMDDHRDKKILWIATNRGLSKLDKTTGRVIHYSYARYDEKDYEKTRVNSFYQDVSGKIWLGTRSRGLIIFNPDNGSFDENTGKSVLHMQSLKSSSITCFLADHSGNLWIGTNYDGIFKVSLENSKFQHYLGPGDALKTDRKLVGAIYQSNNGNVWVGTENKVFHFLRNDKGILASSSNQSFEEIEIGPGRVGGICEDKDGFLWAVTWSGTLNKINPKNREVKIYRGGLNNPLSGWSFRAILCDDENKLWVGSLDEGLEIFDRESQRGRKYTYGRNQHLGGVLALYKGKSGQLWCSTTTGIYAVDLKTHLVKEISFDAKDPGKIQCPILGFFEENDSIIWLASDGCGLYRLDHIHNKIINYTLRDGLPSNNIYSVYKDHNGCLWMSTGKGITWFDVKNNSYKSFDVTDGLQGNLFRWGAHFQNSNGDLFFGGINGFNVFNPDSLNDNPYLPQTVLTNLKISNQVIYPGDTLHGRVILTRDIGYIQNLVLTYRESDVGFEFAGLHYTSPWKNSYEYLLEGYDKNWIATDALNRRAIYTNLPAGKYVFRVRSSNCDGAWCRPEDEVALNIIILPPWWKTWWFRVLIIMVLTTIIYGWYFIRIRHLRMQKQLLEKKVQERTTQINKQREELAMQADDLQEANILLKERGEELECVAEELKAQSEELYSANEELIRLNATKDRFFSIIAHDLRNPFQSLIGFSDLLSAKFDQLSEERKRELLEYVRGSSKSAYNLLENLLNWARSQTNRMEFKPILSYVYLIINDIKPLLELQASTKGVQLIYDIDNEHAGLFDPQMISTVLRNLISNAIKFTPTGGKVICQSFVANRQLFISVKDTGIGMPREIVDNLFRIDVSHIGQGTDGEEGTGLGLILCNDFALKNGGRIEVKSEPGQGSTFLLSLPVQEMDAVNSPLISQEPGIPEAGTGDIAADAVIPDNPAGEKYHILVVEDNKNIRAGILMRLEMGYKVTEASDGVEGLKIARDEMPDLIVSDVMMPGIDGFELCRQLKQDERTNHIPIIMLTARVSDKSKIQGLEIGADDYLTKPFNMEVLIARIRNLLWMREKLKARYGRIVVTLGDNSAEIQGIEGMNKSFLEKIIHIIEENMSDPEFSVEHLAEKINMSRITLYRKLMAISNQNPSELIKTIRLQRAARLLKSGSGNVSEVMYLVGFAHGSRFSESFKKMFGVLPSEYSRKS